MSAPTERECTVVICDDAAGIRFLLREMLDESEGICVVGEAANGRDAIELARRHEPDVMLLDVSMPVMDGIEAMPHIRSASPGTSIVILSGFSSEQVKFRAMAAGAVEYVEKGMDFTAIVAAVRRHGDCA